jgi:hypothetical protein
MMTCSLLKTNIAIKSVEMMNIPVRLYSKLYNYET